MNGLHPPASTDIQEMEQPKPIITAEQILLYGNRQSRLIHLEANVIGYFGHIFRKSGGLAGAASRPPIAAVRVLREVPR